jgi:hypothetical protein
VPVLDRALLQAQPAPDCEFKDQPAGLSAAEVARMKLDYEQQCYRQAEMIARARLEKLQDSVGETLRAVRNRRSIAD